MQSPSGTYGGRISDITNGDVNSWSSRGNDNSTTQLELQMYETQEENNRLKNQVKHLSAKVDSCFDRITVSPAKFRLLS